MKKRNNIWSYLIVAAIFLCIGITLGKLFDWGYFEISRELSVFDALNLFVTVALGLYIAWILERRKQIERVEKDIIVSKIGEIENGIHGIIIMLDEDKIKYSQINSMIHRLSIVRNSLFSELNGIGIRPTKLGSQESVETLIKEERTKLKRLLTETPIQQGGEVEIAVEKNIVKYTDKRKMEIITSACALRELFFVLKMAINRV